MNVSTWPHPTPPQPHMKKTLNFTKSSGAIFGGVRKSTALTKRHCALSVPKSPNLMCPVLRLLVDLLSTHLLLFQAVLFCCLHLPWAYEDAKEQNSIMWTSSHCLSSRIMFYHFRHPNPQHVESRSVSALLTWWHSLWHLWYALGISHPAWKESAWTTLNIGWTSATHLPHAPFPSSPVIKIHQASCRIIAMSPIDSHRSPIDLASDMTASSLDLNASSKS